MRVGTSLRALGHSGTRALGQLEAWEVTHHVIVVSVSPTTPDVVVEEFVRALEPVSGFHLAEAYASVGAEC